MGHLVQNVHVYASAQSASQPRNIIDHHDQLRPHRHTTSTSKNFHMARPTGKYHVGFTNFTYLARNYTIQQDQLVDPQKHLIGAFFYPAAVDGSRSSRPRWIPQYGYSKGFIRFTTGSMRRSKKLLTRITGVVLQPLLTLLGYLLGHSFSLPAYKGVPIADEHMPHPVVLVSHGVGGNRMVHSCLCTELASQGFCVMTLEHADGSASSARLAGRNAPWLFFTGANGEGMKTQLLHRVEEMKTATQLLRSAAEGKHTPGFDLTDAPRGFISTLKGRLDTDCMAAMGHSFGGGPSCALPALSSTFKCGIGLDAYWPSVADDHPVFHKFESPAPLLLIGSQTWNDVGVKSYLRTSIDREEQVVKAASRQQGGGGSISIVIRGIGHASFSDAEYLFGRFMPKTMLSVNPTQTIPPQLCICLLNELILTFLKTHLPLSQLQRERIDPAPLRKMHPSPRSHRQPSGPLEEAQAKVQGVVLGATEDASRSALDPSSGATAPLPTGTTEDGTLIMASEAKIASLQPTIRSSPPRVEASERGVYAAILGQENIFSLRIQE